MNTTTQTQPSGITVLGWRPMRKNSLLGFVTVRLPSGLIIVDITVHAANGRSWVSLPGKPMVDRDGHAMRDPITNKSKFARILDWADKTTADRFNVAVLAALETAHPGALDV